ncbi:MAG: riboflavin biosynthesis protein RibF [Flavipsychrobacter sp.]|jgi:riboflavin kinase/FMN adenylyltransferase|nr:riboflavin biosynthesis protein RibF [Flavipsychrobacter sp.]
MAIFKDTANLPAFKNAVITIGTFDGVHKGHKTILNEVVTHAKNIHGESILLTFEPHPRKLLFPDQPLGIITPLEQKLQLVTDAGIQHVVIVPFTKEFANISAHDYIEKFLVRIFHPHSIIIGYDHRFGHDRKGDIKLLEDYASEYNYELLEIPAQLIDEAAVSSTKIRKAITEGRTEDATQMLGRHYSLSGIVVHGNKLGRTLGYPTANVHPVDADQIIPALGIYAMQVTHNGTKYGAMLSIGYNPTVTDKKELRIEANIFDFDKDIYGDTIELLFVKKLRDEQKFNSLDELKAQLHKDKEDTLSIINGL